MKKELTIKKPVSILPSVLKMGRKLCKLFYNKTDRKFSPLISKLIIEEYNRQFRKTDK
jgi:hypothetical protein